MFTRSFFKNTLAACGAAALIMTSAALPALAAPASTGSDAAIESSVHQTLGRSNDLITVKVDHGHVYLRGQFGTPDEHHDAIEHISHINGVAGIYDHTEDLSGSNS